MSFNTSDDVLGINLERAAAEVREVVLPVGRHEPGLDPVREGRLVAADFLRCRRLSRAEVGEDLIRVHAPNYGHTGSPMSTGIPIAPRSSVSHMNQAERDAAGKRAADLRKRKGLTQAGLAQRYGLDQSSISDFENGKVKEPSAVFVRKLARALDSTADHLLTGEPAEFDQETVAFARRFKELSADARREWMADLMTKRRGAK